MRARSSLFVVLPLTCLAVAAPARAALSPAQCTVAALDATFAATAACPASALTTTASTQAQLAAWLSGPRTTHLEIVKALSLAPGAALATGCDVTIGSYGSLSSAGGFSLSARVLDVAGDLTATGDIVLRGTSRLRVRSGSRTTTQAGLAMTGASLDISGDATSETLYCLAGSTVTSTSYSNNVSYGDVWIRGASVDLHGDYEADGEAQLVSTGFLELRSQGSVRAGNRVHFTASGEMVVNGDVHGADLELFAAGPASVAGSAALGATGNINIGGGPSLDVYADLYAPIAVQLYGDVVTVRAGSTLAPGNYLGIDAATRLSLDGDIQSTDEVSIRAGQMETGLGSLVSSAGFLDVRVTGRLDHRGDIHGVEEVSIQTASYRLYGSHELSGTYYCQISGARDAQSVPATNCVEVP